MLEISNIRANQQAYAEALGKRGMTNAADLLAEVVRTDDKRRTSQAVMDEMRSELNKLSKSIGDLFKASKIEEANALKSRVADLKAEMQQKEEDFNQASNELAEQLLHIPNIPNDKVPAGVSEEDNIVYKDWSAPLPELSNDALPHWDLADKYQLFDFKIGAKITGSGFPLFRGKGARLQRGLIDFFLDEAQKAGYEEIMPPLLVNEATARATGQLPDKEGQMYHVTEDKFYLIPTAEVPLTNIYRDVILKEDELPKKLCGHTPCFRREAGSYGADVKGLNRVHQFEKVEIVQVSHPDHSYQVLDEMVVHVEQLLEKLGLPYRILTLCGGDLGFTSAITYDFEVYSAAQKRWLEVSSVSNFETYQTNRLKLRYKGADKKTHLAHTLNGSALALARIVASLLENYQTPDGIKIPEVLVPYTRFEWIS